MNEILLEQLVKANFPYITSPSYRYGYSWSNSDQLSIPDLSTLIEKCDVNIILWKWENEFYADVVKEQCINNPFSQTGELIEVYGNSNFSGKTPESAVAKLWLKINK